MPGIGFLGFIISLCSLSLVLQLSGIAKQLKRIADKDEK
jgi:hypothetical protein